MKSKTQDPSISGDSHEKGIILAVATMIVLVMMIMMVPFLRKLSAQFRTTEKTYKSGSAFNLAEAGIERALWEINQPFAVEGGMIWTLTQQGTETLDDLRAAGGPLAGDVNILVSPPTPSTPSTRTVESTGLVPFLGTRTVNRTVRVNLEQYYKSIWDFGFFADEGFYSGTRVRIDSYKSTLGPYGGTNKDGPQGHIGTNGTADNSFQIARGGDLSSSSSEIFGNIAAGFGTDTASGNLSEAISLPSETILKGGAERMVLTAPFDMPSVDLYSLPPRDMFQTTVDFTSWFTQAPAVSDPLQSSYIASGYDKGAFTIGRTATSVTLTPANNGIYTSFTLPKQKTVYVQGNVALYVTGLDGATGSFSMNVGSTIEILPNSSLTLILGKTTFTAQNNTFRNDTGVPANLTILGTDQFTADMAWDNNAETIAAIYIPRAAFRPVQGMANIDVYGALVCRYMDLKSNINFHYDQALKDLNDVKGGIPYWKITAWQEKPGGGTQ